MKKILLALMLGGLCLSVSAQDFVPYPKAAVTVQQWRIYYDLVKKNFGASAEDSADQKLTVFHDPKTSTSYAFTQLGHPAHPAWIARQVIEVNGQIDIRQIGYYAGKEAPFNVLFKAYQQMNNEMREALRAQENPGK